MSNKNIFLIIPIFNEKDNIFNLLENIKKHLGKFTTVIFIYDFLDDTSLPVINKIKHNYNFKILTIKNNNKGPVEAIKTGFLYLKSNFCIVTMADGSDNLSTIKLMINKYDSGFDIVCGSRYMKGGSQIGGSLVKSFLSKLAGKSLNIFTRLPTKDCTNNYRLYSKKFLNSITVESKNGFEIGIELVVKAYLSKNFKIAEVPTTWHDRSYGKSNFKLIKWIPSYLKWYLKAFKIYFI